MCRRKPLNSNKGPYTYYWVDLTIVDGVPDKMFGTVSPFRSFCRMQNSAHKNGEVFEHETVATTSALMHLLAIMAKAQGEFIILDKNIPGIEEFIENDKYADIDLTAYPWLLDVFRKRADFLALRLHELNGRPCTRRHRRTCTEE